MKKMKVIVAIIMVFLNVYIVKSQPLWEMAKNNKNVLVVATLFTAGDVRDFLSTPSGLDDAVNWCKQTGITKVYIESYRDAYWVDKSTLEKAKNRFLNEGFNVSGCVTTTRVGKNGVGRGWGSGSCYSNINSQEILQKIFEYTASIFDEIIIDDFLFTECECEECIKERGEQSWSKFRSDLMVKMSRVRILEPARAVNPDVKIIIKYPLWYDDFQKRGYDVARQTTDFDFIYVGTETRDYDYSLRESGEVQYGAYFIMKWLGGIGGQKTIGGWFDPLGTTPVTYREQARQTILAGAKELMLFSYGNLNREINKYTGWIGTGEANVQAFRNELPGLFQLAKIIRNKPIKGIHMPKLANSDPFEESYVFSLIGMLGLPLVPAHEIDERAKTAIFSVHMLEKSNFSVILQDMLNSRKAVAVTDGLAKRLSDQTILENKNLTILGVQGQPKDLLKLSREKLNSIRDHLLEPLGIQFDAPNKVGFFLYGEDVFVVENFNDTQIDVKLKLPNIFEVKKLLVLREDNYVKLTSEKNIVSITLAPRTLIAVKYQ